MSKPGALPSGSSWARARASRMPETPSEGFKYSFWPFSFDARPVNFDLNRKSLFKRKVDTKRPKAPNGRLASIFSFLKKVSLASKVLGPLDWLFSKSLQNFRCRTGKNFWKKFIFFKKFLRPEVKFIDFGSLRPQKCPSNPQPGASLETKDPKRGFLS